MKEERFGIHGPNRRVGHHGSLDRTPQRFGFTPAEIEKQADKTDKKYQVGDLITYTTDVTQRIQNAVAKNVVITDTILTEGVKLQKNSVVLLDAGQNIIENAVIQVIGNSFSIHAGEFLQSADLGEKYTVEYQVMITDEGLIGKEIENEVVVRADNADEERTGRL